jgi:hypothetical protein
MEAMATILQEKGYQLDDVLSRLQTFGAPKELFSRMTLEKEKASQNA